MSIFPFRHPSLTWLLFFATLALPAVALAQSGLNEASISPTYAVCQQKLGNPTAAQLNDPEFSRKYNKKLAVCLLSSGGGTVASEYVDRTRVSQDVEPLSQTPFGEQIGLYSGSLSFEQVDIDAPGNGLPIRLIRHYTTPNVAGTGTSFSAHFTANGMVDWRFELPHIETLSGARGNGNGTWFFIDDTNRCSGLATAPALARNIDGWVHWEPEDWWHGYQLVIPGAGSQDVMDRGPTNNLTPGTMMAGNQSVTFPYTTKSLWAIGCLSATSNGAPGEGFLAVSPDGTKYWLDHLASYDVNPLYLNLGQRLHVLQRQWAMMLVSKIEDRFGNTLTYNYAAGTDQLTSIAASDGRSLSLIWQAWPGAPSYDRIASATLHANDAPDRTWNYAYDDVARPSTPFLKTVTRPDGSTWQFDLSGLMLSSSGVDSQMYSIDCKMGSTDTYHGVQGSGSITHPSGLVGSFTDELVTRGRSYVPYDCNYPDGTITNEGNPPRPPLYSTRAITEKTFSGAGIPSRTWTYSYSDPNACYTSYDHL